ncbi:uncharacterized protein At4g26485-like isoform X2 [Silene latifolia]
MGQVFSKSRETMGQVFSLISYFWRCIRRIKQAETPTTTTSEQQSHYIAIPDGKTVQPEVYPKVPFIVVNLENHIVKLEEEQEEEEEEEVVEKVIQVVTEGDVSTQVSTGSGETLGWIGPYTSKQRILIVGDGDFSFSASLAVAFGSASNMIATSLNRQGFLIKNYSKFLSNKKELESRGCMVIHNVNATNMFRHHVLGKLKFDRIIYNFPHTGCFGRSYSDMLKNRRLVRDFVWNAKKLMNEDGEIHITHKSSFFFSLWDVPKVGREQGLDLLEEIDFDCSLFPGYNPKYGFGGDGNFHYNPSKTYMFGLHPK